MDPGETCGSTRKNQRRVRVRTASSWQKSRRLSLCNIASLRSSPTWRKSKTRCSLACVSRASAASPAVCTVEELQAEVKKVQPVRHGEVQPAFELNLKEKQSRASASFALPRS